MGELSTVEGVRNDGKGGGRRVLQNEGVVISIL